MKHQKNRIPVRNLAVTAMLSAVAALLFYIQISVPFMPSFIQLDVSELPALLASFALGPLSGVTVCLIKNLLHMPFSTTGFVGELSNFLLGCALVLPAGLLYRFRKTKRTAFIGSLIGSLAMGLVSVPCNYFLTYPIYTRFMPLEAILAAYEAIFSGVDGLLSCLLLFNLPFTTLKGLLCSVVVLLIYKPLSPLLKGKKKQA